MGMMARFEDLVAFKCRISPYLNKGSSVKVEEYFVVTIDTAKNGSKIPLEELLNIGYGK